jgi:hypothetical protein
MKPLFIAVITLTALTVKSQDSKNKLFIGFNFSPDYNFRGIKSNGDGFLGDDFIKQRNDNEIAKFGYTTGVSIGLQVSKKVVLETGVQFANMGYKTKNQTFSFETPNLGLPTKVQFIYAYQYINIPIKARVTFGEKRLRLASSIGFNTSFLTTLKQTTILEEANGQTNKSSKSDKRGYRTVGIMPFVGVGVNYALNQKLQLFAEPTFRYGLIRTTSSPVKENLWNAGLNMGVYYTIK